jgi:hypothetical protein
VKEDEVGRTCSTHGGGEGRGVYRVLVGRPEGKRPLGRPRRRSEDNIKMDFRETGTAEFCEHGDKPSGSIKKVGYSLTS